jgi:diacylglycerol kinase family enzyme
VHAVARSPFLGSAALGWWRGPIVAMMNAQYLGRWDVAPRSHPNDGRVDVVSVDAAFGVGDRWKARSRLPLGTHLPHPAITTRQVTSHRWDLGPSTRLWVDGIDLGRVRALTADVEPDAFTVVV